MPSTEVAPGARMEIRSSEWIVRRVDATSIETFEIRRDAAEQRYKPGVRTAIMHRIERLKFEHLLIVSSNRGAAPLDQAISDCEDAAAWRIAGTVEGALLYAALTREKKSAAITGFGEIISILSEDVNVHR